MGLDMFSSDPLSEGAQVRDALFEARSYAERGDIEEASDALAQDVVRVWASDVDLDAYNDFCVAAAEAVATGNAAKAAELLARLMAALIAAVPTGDDVDRGRTPDEMRKADPRAFDHHAPIMTISREYVPTWLGIRSPSGTPRLARHGRIHVSGVGRSRPRGAGRPRPRRSAAGRRASASRAGPDSDSDGEPEPPPAAASHLLARLWRALRHRGRQ